VPPPTGERAERRPASAVDEDVLTARLRARLGSAPDGELWSGDDAAVLRPPAGSLLVTTDMLVEGVDFESAWASPADVGWKSIAVNASDIAAMGGAPRHAVTAVGLGTSTPGALVDGLADGMIEAATTYAVALVGGDLSRAPRLTVAVAMTGEVDAGGAVPRSGARPGDALCVTGSLGGAAGGLVALRRHGAGPDLGPPLARLAQRQLRPRARVAEGRALRSAGASAMIDLSDGLAVDLARLVAASGVGCEVDVAALPLDDDLQALGSGPEADPIRLAVVGGEDFELLCALAPELLGDACARVEECGTALTQIGEVTRGGARLGGVDLDEWRERGWDHLRAP
jgi:thiamine-monophosphate kinase